MTKMHKFVVYAIDFNDEGVTFEDISNDIRNASHWWSGPVFYKGSVDIGEFDDDHPINKKHEEILVESYFKK
jgi:hypothetical protein